MNKVNYQAELEKLIKQLPDGHRRLFLHSCCAPCSSYCLEYLRKYFDVTVFYYNPNISFGGGVPASGRRAEKAGRGTE